MVNFNYTQRYFISLSTAIVAAFAFVLQISYQSFVYPDSFTGSLVMIAAMSAVGFAIFILHRKGLILLKSCPKDYVIYMFVFVFSILMMTFIAFQKGLFVGAELLNPYIMLDNFPEEFNFSVRSLITGGFSAFFKMLWAVIVFLIRPLLQIMLMVFYVQMLIVSLIWLVLCYWLDIKNALAIVISLLVISIAGFAWMNSVPHLDYARYGVVALCCSYIFAINWRSLNSNGDFARLNSMQFEVLSDIYGTDKQYITSATLQEKIEEKIAARFSEYPPELIDRIQQRLIEERFFDEAKPGVLALAKRKNMKLWHVFAFAGASLYLMNPGFGFIELIPDNIPMIGNLDEVGIAIMALKLFWDNYRKDQRVRQGEDLLRCSDL